MCAFSSIAFHDDFIGKRHGAHGSRNKHEWKYSTKHTFVTSNKNSKKKRYRASFFTVSIEIYIVCFRWYHLAMQFFRVCILGACIIQIYIYKVITEKPSIHEMCVCLTNIVYISCILCFSVFISYIRWIWIYGDLALRVHFINFLHSLAYRIAQIFGTKSIL